LKSATTPSVIALSRQNLPNLVNSTIENASRGGYVLREVQNEAITFVSTGSEVSIVLEAAGLLEREGIVARVVSLPCWEVFDAQDEAYRAEVLRSGAPILSVEPYSTLGWERYSHEQFGLAGWGASGPYKKVYEKFGITGPNIAQLAKRVVDFYKAQGVPVISPLKRAL